MNKRLTFLTIFLILQVLGLFIPDTVKAAEPSLSIRPDSGQVIKDDNFTIDLLIDSGGEEIVLGRAVVVYDPRKIEVIEVERNDDLFCSWPEEEQTVDQENGVIMFNGFCQSGVGDPYKTVGDADVLARIQFRVLETGTVSIEYEWSGTDQEFKSVLMKDGSPPANVLDTVPEGATFTAVESDMEPDDEEEEVPDTAIFPWENQGFTIGLFALSIAAIIVIASWIIVLAMRFKSTRGTKTIFQTPED